MISIHFQHYKPLAHSPLFYSFSPHACESEEEKFAGGTGRTRKDRTRVRGNCSARGKKEEARNFQSYSENSLARGAKPWANCFGRSNSCNSNGCSEIVVNGPSGSDVVVLLKQNGVTKRHVIPAGRSYTFNIPNGMWQPFFYYGEGWYPDKEMKSPRAHHSKAVSWKTKTGTRIRQITSRTTSSPIP